MSMNWLQTNPVKGIAGVVALACGVTLMVVPVPGQAQWATFDVANFGQNLKSALNAVRQVENQVMSYRQQIIAYKQQVESTERRIKALTSTDLQGIDDPRFIFRYEQQLESLANQIGTTRQSVQQQIRGWTQSGLTQEQYFGQEIQMAKSGQAYAVAGLNQATSEIRNLNQQAKVVQAQSDKIGKVVGETQNLNLMQAQLNTIAQQGQQMLQLVATAQKNQYQQQAEQKARDQLKNKIAKDFDKRWQDTRSAQQKTDDFFNGFTKAMTSAAASAKTAMTEAR